MAEQGTPPPTTTTSRPPPTSGCLVVHRVHSAGRWQAAVAPVLLVELSCSGEVFPSASHVFLCLPAPLPAPQGFHDQPGVEPQRLLSAQRRHHLLQPLAVQLNDLQVDPNTKDFAPSSRLFLLPPGGSRTRPPPPNLPSCPSSCSLDSVPLAQPVSAGLTHACTNRRQRFKKAKNTKAKRINRLCVQFKGLIFAQKVINFFFFFCVCARARVLGILLPGGNFNRNINRMFVSGGEGMMTSKRNEAIFSSRETQEQDVRHWSRCYILYMHLHPGGRR